MRSIVVESPAVSAETDDGGARGAFVLVASYGGGLAAPKDPGAARVVIVSAKGRAAVDDMGA